MTTSRYDLSGKSALITGGGGLLGPEHGIGLARCGAQVILIDICKDGLEKARQRIRSEISGADVRIETVDVTNQLALVDLREKLKAQGTMVGILVNNAAINPTMNELEGKKTGTVENYDMELWQKELDVGITGTFLCCKVFGPEMAVRGWGAIVNIASDSAIQAPDQRVYSVSGRMEDVEHFKPIGYSVVKASMLGLNRYLATYWAHRGVRVNCLAPGAVFNHQDDSLVRQVSERVPLQRWAMRHEYQEAVSFLASDASSYMTGQILTIDGGRSIW